MILKKLSDFLNYIKSRLTNYDIVLQVTMTSAPNQKSDISKKEWYEFVVILLVV